MPSFLLTARTTPRHFTVAELVKKLADAQVPCSPINNMEQVFNHPQALHRGMVQKVEHADYGPLSVIGPAVKYSGFDIASEWQAPPLLGEHTKAVSNDWRRERERDTKAAYLAKLRDKYGVAAGPGGTEAP